jgi:hypothetical protein
MILITAEIRKIPLMTNDENENQTTLSEMVLLKNLEG